MALRRTAKRIAAGLTLLLGIAIGFVVTHAQLVASEGRSLSRAITLGHQEISSLAHGPEDALLPAVTGRLADEEGWAENLDGLYKAQETSLSVLADRPAARVIRKGSVFDTTSVQVGAPEGIRHDSYLVMDVTRHLPGIAERIAARQVVLHSNSWVPLSSDWYDAQLLVRGLVLRVLGAWATEEWEELDRACASLLSVADSAFSFQYMRAFRSRGALITQNRCYELAYLVLVHGRAGEHTYEYLRARPVPNTVCISKVIHTEMSELVGLTPDEVVALAVPTESPPSYGAGLFSKRQVLRAATQWVNYLTRSLQRVESGLKPLGMTSGAATFAGAGRDLRALYELRQKVVFLRQVITAFAIAPELWKDTGDAVLQLTEWEGQALPFEWEVVVHGGRATVRFILPDEMARHWDGQELGTWLSEQAALGITFTNR